MKLFYIFNIAVLIFFSPVVKAQNLGFENGLTEWTSLDSGTWSVNTLASNLRSGVRSAQIITGSTSDGKLYNSNVIVTSPSTGTNYITVIAWIKSSNVDNRVAVGASDGINEYKGFELSVPTASFLKVEYTFPASNNTTYYPYVYGRSYSGTLDTLYYDDVIIYTSSVGTTDMIPPSFASRITATTNSAEISLAWTPGLDDNTGSGIDGTLILRRTGTREANQSVNTQTYYSASDPLVGPTNIGLYTVVYNGIATNTFTDNPGANGIYTYLIYMRDKAYNYTNSSDAARIFVFNGTGLSSSTTLNTRLDGLYLPESCTFTSNSSSTVTIRAGADIEVGGTIINQGNVYTRPGANVGFNNGSLYEYRKNGSVGPTMFSVIVATWHPGSKCKITGITTTFPNSLDQTFADFIWDCPSQTVSDTLASSVAPTIISGDFTVISTGSGRIMLSKDAGSTSVGGNFYKTGGTLDAGDGATVILNGDENQNISVNGGYVEGTFNLTINNTNGVTLDSDLFISGVLTLQYGIVTTGPNKTVIGPGGSVVRSGGHINGYLKKHIPTGNGYTQFEIGDNSEYAPVQVELNNVITPAYLTASTLPVDHPDITNSGLNPDKSVNRNYSFNNEGVIFDSAAVNLNYVADDLDPGANPDNFIVKKYDSPIWTAPKTIGRTSTSTLAGGVTSFSDFAVGEGDIFTISASSDPNGTITPNGMVLVAEGTDKNFTINPNTGYHLDSLIVNGLHSDSATSYTFYYVTTNHSISAHFSINRYTLSVNAIDGIVIKDPDQLLYDHGSIVQLTPQPQTGYHFMNWSGDIPSGRESDNPLTITMDQDKSITAVFSINTYTLNVTAENGTVGINPPEGPYDQGTLVILTPNPATGYHFVTWSGDVPSGRESDNPLTVMMDQNRSLTANFAINNYTINATAGQGGGISPAGLVSVHYGVDLVFTITPDLHYAIDSMFVDGSHSDSTSSYTFRNITDDHTIHATFKEILNPVPVLTGISPASGFRGDTLFVLFNGTNISADAVINLGIGVSILEQNHFGENIEAKIFLNNNTFPGVRNFSVTNPPPGGGNSNEIAFIVHNNIPVAFGLSEPADGGIIQLTTNPQPIKFAWHPSADGDLGDVLTYTLHFPGTSLEDSIIVGGDTSVALDYMSVLSPNTVYYWSVGVTDGYDTVESIEVFSFLTSAEILAADMEENGIPSHYALCQNYPNPFNPITKIEYQLPVESRVILKVYGMLGQVVGTLCEEEQSAGYKSVIWQASGVSSGIYFYRLSATSICDPSRSFTETVKMILAR